MKRTNLISEQKTLEVHVSVISQKGFGSHSMIGSSGVTATFRDIFVHPLIHALPDRGLLDSYSCPQPNPS